MASTSINKKNFSSIVSIDPLSMGSYRYKKNEFQVNKLTKFKKDEFTVSYIQTKDTISASININRSIPEDDLKDAIEIKAYEELGLDVATQYNIISMENEESGDDKNRFFNVFAINADKVAEDFQKIKKQISYIDYITPAPFLIKSLYNRNLLERGGMECFIYFHKNDAFLTLYRDGEYLYSKSLRYSLEVMNEKFCELVGKRVDEKDFFSLLTNEGLKSTNLTYQQHLMKLFGEIFLYINDIIIFAKRAYNIDNISRIFIGSEIGNLVGIDEYSKSYLGLDSSEFNFSIAINSKEWYVDQMHILMVLTALDYLETGDEEFNLSIFKRPPPFQRRPIGKLIGAIAASLILSLAYPGYQAGYNYKLQYDLSLLKDEYNKIVKITNNLKAQLKKLNDQKKVVSKKLEAENSKLSFRKKLLNEIYAKKVAYPMKAKILSDLFNYVNRYKSNVSEVDISEDEKTKHKQLVLSIFSKDEKKITELIKSLAEQDKYEISTDEIKEDETKHIYLSNIKVVLND